MKLLIITRKVDSRDSRVGFFSKWIEVFAQRVDTLSIITWQQSDTAMLPHNVKLQSLSGSHIKKIMTLQRLLLQHRKQIEGVFTHMNPEYAIIAFPLCFLLEIPIVAWYAHGAVTLRRRIMELLVTKIISSSAKGFREPLFKNKLHIVGQGIDTSLFTFSEKSAGSAFRIIYVGRISPVKDIETIIKALSILQHNVKKQIYFDIYGAPALEIDHIYLNNLKAMAEKMQLARYITFHGGVAYRELPAVYKKADMLVNMSTTGSMDKTVLEALASGCRVLTANDAYKGILSDSAMVQRNNPEQLAKRLKDIMSNDIQSISIEAKKLRKYVEKEHSLPRLIDKILTHIPA